MKKSIKSGSRILLIMLLIFSVWINLSAAGYLFGWNDSYATEEIIEEEESVGDVIEPQESGEDVSEEETADDSSEVDTPDPTENEEQPEITEEPDDLMSAQSEDPVEIGTQVNGKGTLELSNKTPEAGDTVSITKAEPDDGYYLAQIRLAVTNESEETTYSVIDNKNFQMPEDAAAVNVYADFISIKWDGTIDLTWYDPSKTTYDIEYAAQFAGAAALANGLFNDIPTREVTYDGKTVNIPDVTGADGKTKFAPDTTTKNDESDAGSVTSNDGSGYQTFKSIDNDNTDTTVVGDLSLIKILHTNTGDGSGSNNVMTTPYYWYGGEDFYGKTINLKKDINMGGVCSGTKTLLDSWTGPNYMPLGGGYSMILRNGYTRLGASFNGTLNGNGYMVYNVYMNRRDDTGNFGNCQGVGLIGRLGLNRVEHGTQGKPSVKNIAVDGFFYGNRMIGGIVGQLGHAKPASVIDCINFATVMNTDAKGCAGIIGNATFSNEYGDTQPVVTRCVNFGFICTGYNKNAGGLVGLSEAKVVDSYTIGFAAGSDHIYGGNASAGNSLGTNNGGALWYNVYTFKSASTTTKNNPGTETTEAYGSTEGSAIYVFDDTDKLINGTLQGMLNGKVTKSATVQDDGSDYGYIQSEEGVIQGTRKEWTKGEATDSQKFISGKIEDSLKSVISWHNPSASVTTTNPESIASGLKSPTANGALGMPVPNSFVNQTSSPNVTEIVFTGTPKLSYYEGERFNTGDKSKPSTSPNNQDEDAEFSVWAIYDDNSWYEISDYTIEYPTKENEFATGDTQVTVKGEFGGKSYSKTITGITVEEIELMSLEITSPPKITVYGNGETYRENNNKELDGLIFTSVYGKDGNKIKTLKVEYKDGRKIYTLTNEEDKTSEVLSDEQASAYDFSISPSEKLTLSDDVIKVTHVYLNKTLEATTPITVVDTKAYAGIVKDSSDNWTISISKTEDFIWFAEQVASGNKTDINANLKADLDLSSVEKLDPVGVKYKGLTTTKTGNAYSGTFDGGGHSVKLDMERTEASTAGVAGLFYNIAEGGCVKSLYIKGTVKGKDDTGSIAGRLSGGKIVNCGNTAELSSEPRSGATVGTGGIVGKISNGDVESCFNLGDVSGTGAMAAGGIAGAEDAKESTHIDNCYNGGKVSISEDTSTSYAGGIVGYISGMSTPNRVKNCYNTGAISSSDGNATYVAGIVGRLYTFNNVSNNLMLEGTADKSIISAKSNATPADSNGKTVSVAALKSSVNTLGSAYVSSDGCTPALSWEGVSGHHGSEVSCDRVEVIKEPTATKKGIKANVTKECSLCHAALKWDSSTEEDILIPTSLLTVEGIANKTFNGQAQTQKLLVKAGDKELNEGTDYTVSYKNNVNAGTATVIITGAGDYTGTNEKTFKINPMSAKPTVTLAKTAFTYNSKVQKPGVTVKVNGKAITATNYNVVYPAGCKNLGTYKVTVNLKGNYTGSNAASYKINPAGTSLSSAKAAKKKATIKWKKQANQTAGYQIQYSTDKTFKTGAKTATVSGAKKTSTIIKKLKSKKVYYFRIRTYKKVGSVTYYSGWSAVKKAKIK